jgi:hypothetical protein
VVNKRRIDPNDPLEIEDLDRGIAASVAQADRRDNRRSLLVAVAGILIIAIFSGVRIAAAPQSGDRAVPVPTPTATGQSAQLPTAAFHGDGTDGDHGVDTPLVLLPRNHGYGTRNDHRH